MRRRIRFRGNVQGVGFRATAESIASRHDVTGWVRNEPDGSVLMEIQGPEDEIDAVLEGLSRRMDALIRNQSVDRVDQVDQEQGFSIRY